MAEIENSTSTPGDVFYGLHFLPGVAEYRPPDQDPYRVFLSEETIKKMDSSFRGKPLFVGHVEGKEDYNKQDGVVVESFYNPIDGKTWAKFVAISDSAKEAIRSGRKLSNAYTPKSFGAAGLWNGVEYDKEVTGAVYDHMALVPDPRYAESIILTPEEFKEYCDHKKMELAKIANSIESKGETMQFWKKSKVENSLELESTMVELPKSKSQADLKTVINESDEYRLAMKLPQMANDEHGVELEHPEHGKQKMSVGELKNAYNKMCQDMMDMKKKNDSEEEERHAPEEEKHEEMKGEEGVEAKEKAKNDEHEIKAEKAEKDEVKKSGMKNEDQKDMGAAEEKKKNAIFNELKNAHLIPFKETVSAPDLSSNRVARGKSRYGSAN